MAKQFRKFTRAVPALSFQPDTNTTTKCFPVTMEFQPDIQLHGPLVPPTTVTLSILTLMEIHLLLPASQSLKSFASRNSENRFFCKENCYSPTIEIWLQYKIFCII